MSQERHTDDVQNSAETSFGGINRRTYIKGAIAAGALAFGPSTAAADSHEEEGGPVVLMGLDSEEDGGSPRPTHGQISTHADIVDAVLDDVDNDGDGILVIGEADGTGTQTDDFWQEVGAGVDEDLTHVAGASDIADQSFDGFAMLAVVTSAIEIGGPGGLTNDENEALANRAQDVADFVNNGGGLLGKSQAGLDNEWAYIGGLGSFETETGLSYEQIEITDEGADLGLTDDLSGFCCWHDVFLDYPEWLDVLATHDGIGAFEGEASVLGGRRVEATPRPTPEECVDLIAHKSRDPDDGSFGDIGEVCVDDDGDTLTVSYETNEDWELDRTFVEVADDLFETGATNEDGEAVPSGFGYRKHHTPAVDSTTHEIGFSDFEGEPGDIVMVAATAHVNCTVGDASTQDAWSDGERFVNYQIPTYFTYELGGADEENDNNDEYDE